MATTTIEPLRWLEDSARITICQDGDNPQSYYQVTAPRQISAMCIGRPVEELPRIVSILSPSHHLASAMALDDLFSVTPPPLALNVRQALAQSHIFIHHLRKLFSLAASYGSPLELHRGPRSQAELSLLPHHVLDEIMHSVALAQEAATILGGRSAHPLTAVPGGVSRYLKEEHGVRLTEIAEFCLTDALRFKEILTAKLIGVEGAPDDLPNRSFPALPSLALSALEEEAVVLTDASGSESMRFTPDQVADTLETCCEPWTYQPFVHLKEKTWLGPLSTSADDVYFVGPLARLNRNQPATTPLAEQERQHLISSLGDFPHFTIMAAYWSLLVELIAAAEKMRDLYTVEHLLGSGIRTLPASPNPTGQAAFEAPEGFIYHQYRVDERGIVEDLTILDAAAQNNTLRCLLTQNIVADAAAHGKPWDETKRTIELSLLPF